MEVEDLPGKLLPLHVLVHDMKPVLPLENDGKLGGIVIENIVQGSIKLINLLI